jgi:DNA polymerase I-like protein with 3'-5' exonuclease and polymerase domains
VLRLRDRLRGEVAAGRPIGFDTEWEAPSIIHRGKARMDGLRADSVGWSAAVLGEPRGWYLPLRCPEELDPQYISAARGMLRLVERPEARVVAHNWKGELHVLGRMGLVVACRMVDSELLAWLAGWKVPGSKHGLALKTLIEARFGRRRPDFAAMSRGRPAGSIPLAEIGPYAAQDAVDALELGVAAGAACRDLGLLGPGGQWELDRKCIDLTAGMEATGVRLDEPALLSAADACDAELAGLEASFQALTRTTVLMPTKVREAMSCPDCELAPWQTACQHPGCVSGVIHYKNGKPKLRTAERQLPTERGAHPGNDGEVSRWLFDELRWWPVEGHPATANGWSTKEEHIRRFTTLEGPAGEAARLRLRYQALRKYSTTYTRGLVSLARQSGDGRLHSTFRQDGTTTQRYSSSGPNQQNLPGSHRQPLPWLGGLPDIRAAFRTDPGWKLVIRDFSQVELRIVAHYSRDPGLLEVYRTGGDIHARTMEALGGIERKAAKTTNFSVCYRISAPALARKIAMATNDYTYTAQRAQGFIDGFYDAYPGVAQMHEEFIIAAERAGYAETITGFKRPLTEWRGRVRWSTENEAINTPIQGSAGGLIKLAMSNLWTKWNAEGILGGSVRFVAQVHDEVIVECRAELAERVDADMAAAMAAVGPMVGLRVPLDSSGGIGDSWADAKG